MNKAFLAFLCLLFAAAPTFAQSNRVISFFPKGTVLHANLPYHNDTLQKHLLDIYLPPNASGKLPLVIWVHGGGWLSNDKYADMGYMQKTIAAIINSGYALASIDYRFSTQARFPAQIQDCNAALAYLFNNAGRYQLDTSRFALMGFSAGGHLASLLGLSHNNRVPAFYTSGARRMPAIKAVVDFYGPADLVLFPGSDSPQSPEGLLLGAAPLARPDLAKAASPISYVDKNDPPFLIIHGERDDMVAPKQSQLLRSWLQVSGVPSELIIVKDAPHFGVQFDVEEVRGKVMQFLQQHLK
ncbi:Acetyl esterase/lipase [Cnuella takakiae]|uniref:Acetyl esterase/lipase n=1 Tax=Cnuella takakiae TaxID=1302690 RepID=A0A1M5CLB1_9BACT|nr:alpha/beta hydrolase [Cnuella takakiae]OLY91868.1 lipase [Cnuella takakiae]SHF55499.1 Acetyl esterase/lipase [Cnuella takakiae]